MEIIKGLLWGIFHYVFGFGGEAVFHIVSVLLLLGLVLLSSIQVNRAKLRKADKE